MGLLYQGRLGGLGALGVIAKRLQIWGKADVIPTEDSRVWRRDADGRTIRFNDYGDRNSPYGWEFDHYPVPDGLGGSDDISNLRPLHWQGNASRGGRLGDLLSDLDVDFPPLNRNK